MSAPGKSRLKKRIQDATARMEYENAVQGLKCPWLGSVKDLPTIPGNQLKSGSLYIYYCPRCLSSEDFTFAGYILGRVTNFTDKVVIHNLWQRRYRSSNYPPGPPKWKSIDTGISPIERTIDADYIDHYDFFDLTSLGPTQYELLDKYIETKDPETICKMYKELATVHEQVKHTLSKSNPQAFQTDGTLKHIFDYVGGKRSTKGRRKTSTTGLPVKNRTQRKNRRAYVNC